MPLVIVAGHPCSGKSSIAAALSEALTTAGLAVQLVSENQLFSDRNACYRELRHEKNTRAKIKSLAEKHCSKTTTVVLDTLSNIKGYRYELWCIARAAGTKCCVLWVDTPIDICREWNSERPPEQAYAEDVFADLAGRFEEPNAQTRWDSPLHRINPVAAAVPAAADSQSGSHPPQQTGVPGQFGPDFPFDDDDSLAEEQDSNPVGPFDPTGPYEGLRNGSWRAGTGGANAPEGALESGGVQRSRWQDITADIDAVVLGLTSVPGKGPSTGPLATVSKALTPNLATQTQELSQTNLLYELDKAAQGVIQQIMDGQTAAGPGQPAGTISFGPGLNLVFHEPVTLAELRRIKRGFVKVATSGMGYKLSTGDPATRVFVSYLRSNLKCVL